MSKYDLLWEYIGNSKQDEIILSFEEIKSIAKIDIDHSFLLYKKELLNYKYKVEKISIKKETVRFVKIS